MSEPDAPRSRGWWWKVPLALVALLLLAAFVAHAIWTARERAGVARRVAAIRALGEPIDVADLVEPDVPDAENAAVAIRAAAAALVEPQDRKERRRAMEGDDPHAFELPLTDGEVELLRATIADNSATLTLLDEAARRPKVAWGVASPGTPLMLRLLPDLNRERQLANLLNDAARLDAHDDRGAATIFMRLATIDALAPAVCARRSLITSMVAAGMQWMSAATTIAIAPRLSLAALADRDAARARIAMMLDDASIEESFRVGLLGERVTVHEAVAAIRGGTLGPATLVGTKPTASTAAQRLGVYVMMPVFNRSDAILLDYFAAALPTLDAPDLADWRTRSTTMQQIERAADASKLAILPRLLMPSLDRVFLTRYRLVTELHLAAVALATRLYALDHAGGMPPSLETLAPSYLPAVPTDAIDGNPLRYDAARAIVWSVGDNGIDDGGDETTRRSQDAGNRWSMKDAVVHLTPRPRPATRPGE